MLTDANCCLYFHVLLAFVFCPLTIGAQRRARGRRLGTWSRDSGGRGLMPFETHPLTLVLVLFPPLPFD